MSRKRKKNKSAGGSNPSNDLYNHPSVVAARGRKDANTPGGAPKKSKPRRSRGNVLRRWNLFESLVIVVCLLILMFVFRARAAFVLVGVSLILGAVVETTHALTNYKPWSVTIALRASVVFALAAVIAAGRVVALSGSGCCPLG